MSARDEPHHKVIDDSWPAPGHCSDCSNGYPADHPSYDYLPWDQAEALGHPGDWTREQITPLDYDPCQHRRRIALSRAMLEAVLDLREDVHIIGLHVLADPMFVDITVTSPRFPIVSEEWEQRLERGMTEPTAQGPRWREEAHDGERPRGAMQNDREPGWMEGWRLAIEWLREQNSALDAAQRLADEMETRLP